VNLCDAPRIDIIDENGPGPGVQLTVSMRTMMVYERCTAAETTSHITIHMIHISI
jgi:hypothetical protein